MNYRDRHGRIIRIGGIVVMAVTINRERYPEGFTVNIVRRGPRRRLILDGSVGWMYLKECSLDELEVIGPDTDLVVTAQDFVSLVRRKYGKR